eukprot:jgi/Botrbrau1/21589/Bobra.0719s0001.1
MFHLSVATTCLTCLTAIVEQGSRTNLSHRLDSFYRAVNAGVSGTNLDSIWAGLL